MKALVPKETVVDVGEVKQKFGVKLMTRVKFPL